MQNLTDGVLPDFMIQALIGAGAVSCPSPAERQVQPASLDLRLGDVAYRVRSSFLPGPGRTVLGEAEALCLGRVDLARGEVLAPGGVYLVPLQESVSLPRGLRARANPKSSTGRLDVFARLIVDGASSFDEVPAGYEGPLWVELAPRTFPVLVRRGSRLVQMRFVNGGAPLDAAAHRKLHERVVLARGGQPTVGAGVVLTVDLEWGPHVAAWRARRHTGAVDVDLVGTLDHLDFWEPVRPARGGVVLDPGEFYIMASREAVRVPEDHAAEMMAFDAGVGEFRAHYAGFFDPGFGCGEGVAGRAVLEVRPRDVPFLMRQGQAVCRLVYEPMAAVPARPYGAGSNYQDQRLKLSKAFAAFPASTATAA